MDLSWLILYFMYNMIVKRINHTVELVNFLAT